LIMEKTMMRSAEVNTVFDRLLRPLAEMRSVRSVTLLDTDGFLIHTTSSDATNSEAQRLRWSRLCKERGGERITMVFERGVVVVGNAPLGVLLVHAAHEVNLGALYTLYEATLESIRDTGRRRDPP